MRRTSGFTLFELLIVLALLGILAGISVPQYFNARAESNEAALMTDLEVLREAIERYQAEHGGTPPGLSDGKPSDTAFENQLTGRTNSEGSVQATGKFGPYLVTGIPANPFNGLKTVWLVSEGDLPQPNNNTGWIFHLPSVTLRANSPEYGPEGTPLSTL